MLEKELEAKVVKYAKDHGILTYKFVSPNNRGVPDRIFLNRGKVLFLEFKTGKNTVTLLQRREINRILDSGHPAFEVYDYDYAVYLIDLYVS